MEVSKAEIEDQVKKILKLVKNKKNGVTKDSKRLSELVGLINNLHDQYQSLYSQYNHLKEESEKKSCGREDKGLNLSPDPSSDSDEYYSSEEIEINTDNLTNADQKTGSSFEQELKVSGLRNKLMSPAEENEALNPKYQEALSIIKAEEVMNKKLRNEEDKRQREISALVKVDGSQASAQIEELEGQLSCIKLEYGTLHDQKRDLEAQCVTIANEANQLREKNKELHAQVSKLELISKEKENEVSKIDDLKSQILEEQTDSKFKNGRQLRKENKRLYSKISQTENELSTLKRTFEDREKEAATQNLALKAKVNNLQQALDNLQVKKIQLNSQIVSEKQECSKSLTELEQQNIKLTNKIADQQKIMKNQEDTIKNLTEESKKAKPQILGSKTSLQIAEKKMIELAEDFRKILEDNIRVLFRRIQVAEQLHNETKDSYKKTMDQLVEKESLLREEVSNLEAQLGKQAGDKLNMIKTMSDLEKKVGELEDRIKEQDAELLCLGELKNRIIEQDAELLSLGEEKREAIRQLCLSIDYHRTDCDYLKQEIAKTARTSKTQS